MTDYSIQCNSLRCNKRGHWHTLEGTQAHRSNIWSDNGISFWDLTAVRVFLPSKWSPAHHWSPSNLSCWWMSQAAEGSPVSPTPATCAQCVKKNRTPVANLPALTWMPMELLSAGLWRLVRDQSSQLGPCSRCLLEVIVGALAVLYPFGSSS